VSQFLEDPVIVFALLMWLLSEVIGAAIIPLLRPKGKVKTRSDRGSGIVVRLMTYASVSLCIYFAIGSIAILPGWFSHVGVTIMLLGIALRQWAIWVLGGFFSTEVKIISNQRIVKGGPYRLLRHPSYTGLLMIMLRFGLAARTWLGTVATLFLFSSAIGYRIKVEEKALKKEFGEEYLDYAQKTKRLIPFLY
jgi:protein-S-isoprenylcysteine O-methyltransferase Ste14